MRFRLTPSVNASFRAAVCQAIVGMLAQVGIRATFQPWPTATFFPKLTQATSSFFEFGWSPLTDAWPSLYAMVHSHGADGAGTFNGGRYSNPRLDQLLDAIRVEPDLSHRRQLVGDALRLMRDDLPLIPLYRRTLTWAMRPDISVAQWPNDILELRFVQIGDREIVQTVGQLPLPPQTGRIERDGKDIPDIKQVALGLPLSEHDVLLLGILPGARFTVTGAIFLSIFRSNSSDFSAALLGPARSLPSYKQQWVLSRKGIHLAGQAAPVSCKAKTTA